MIKIFLFALAACLVLASAVADYTQTALDVYVNTPDENYGWVELPDKQLHGKTLFGRGWTGYAVNMTSQRWLTDADFSAGSESGSIWWHCLIIIVPDDIKWDRNASLYLTGGSNNPSGACPDAKSEDIRVAAALAMANSIVTGALFQIPNEHTTFTADPLQKSRTEDSIIAFTWDHFLKDTSKPEWLLRFPMVKASLRAMDTITDFMKKKFPEKNLNLDYYAVAGASKRGWTTWDVGAVDTKRVMAIIPIVLDAINFVDVLKHQYRSYGNWSFALQDYADMNIMTRLDTPEMRALQQQVDPYFYRERLTMPKLVVNAVLDEFQQPDDNMYWWNGMPEPKHVIMTPNAEHSEATGIFEIVPAISSWIKSLLDQKPLPEFTWEISSETGAITATLNEHGEVHEANMWYAYSCGNNADGTKRRDFRVAMLDKPCKCGLSYDGYCGNLKSFWTKKPLEMALVNGKRTYTAHMDAPGDGRWVAYMIEITYADKNIPRQVTSTTSSALAKDATSIIDRIHNAIDGIIDKIPTIPTDLLGRLIFTTQISVWPQTFPYEECVGEACGNNLC